jgi:calcium-dependent protein kinase
VQDRDDVRQEVAIMDHLSGHPNVVKLEDVFEDKRNVHMVMEICTGGELFDRIVARGHYSEKSAAQIIRAIVLVVAHCHSMGVVHRDLKPENFLLSCAGSVSELKAIDFGLSTFFQPGKMLSDIVGSAYYVAPEVLRKKYSSQCDIWSCGVILYILLCGIPPFYAETEMAIFRAVIKGDVDFVGHPWPRISPEAKDCVKKMLTRDVNVRATASQILKVPVLPSVCCLHT